MSSALEELPETARDLQTGAISFSHARELTRVATPSTEKEWLETARGRTVREVEQLVSGHRPGSLPADVTDLRLKKHRLCLELSGEVFATYREAMAKVRRDAGESIDEETAILLLCRQALEGNRDPGRASYPIALTVCERCRRATQQGRGEAIEVGPDRAAHEPQQRLRRCRGVGHHDLAPTPFDRGASSLASSPACPSAPHGFSRFRRASARAAPALGGTRAHRPKAEHAGRTAPHPRAGQQVIGPHVPRAVQTRRCRASTLRSSREGRPCVA